MKGLTGLAFPFPQRAGLGKAIPEPGLCPYKLCLRPFPLSVSPGSQAALTL